MWWERTARGDVGGSDAAMMLCVWGRAEKRTGTREERREERRGEEKRWGGERRGEKNHSWMKREGEERKKGGDDEEDGEGEARWDTIRGRRGFGGEQTRSGTDDHRTTFTH